MEIYCHWPYCDVKNQLQKLADLFDDITEAEVLLLSNNFNDVHGFMKRLTSVKELTIYRQTLDMELIECLRDHLPTYADLEKLSLYMSLDFETQPMSEHLVRQHCPNLKTLRVPRSKVEAAKKVFGDGLKIVGFGPDHQWTSPYYQQFSFVGRPRI
jgi:hypothetical protein